MVLLHAGWGWSDDGFEFIQQLPDGQVNWSKGILIIKNSFDADVSQDAVLGADSLLREEITRKMLQGLRHIRVDARRSLSDLIARKDDIHDKLFKIAQTAPLYHCGYLSDGRAQVAIQVQLYGGFSQIMLPEEVKQVEPIKAITNGNTQGHDSKANSKNRTLEVGDDIYTGLIIDARGINVQPALVPRLVDENNVEVYGAAFVSREFAVQQGVCEYARSLAKDVQRRVGQRPLSVKGLGVAPGADCDIVISNADAAKLHSASAHLTFLKQCRVVVLLD